jgi:hypothetical protein
MSARRDDTPDGRDSVLDGVDIHTVISGTERIPETVTDVIAAEGSPEGVSAAGVSAFVAWLFEEDAEPGQVTLEEFPALAADDASFVWVDLSGYGPSDITQVAHSSAEAGLEVPQWDLRPRPPGLATARY